MSERERRETKANEEFFSRISPCSTLLSGQDGDEKLQLFRWIATKYPLIVYFRWNYGNPIILRRQTRVYLCVCVCGNFPTRVSLGCIGESARAGQQQQSTCGVAMSTDCHMRQCCHTDTQTERRIEEQKPRRFFSFYFTACLAESIRSVEFWGKCRICMRKSRN